LSLSSSFLITVFDVASVALFVAQEDRSSVVQVGFKKPKGGARPSRSKSGTKSGRLMNPELYLLDVEPYPYHELAAPTR